MTGKKSENAMTIPLILLPGLAASHEVFAPQLQRFSNALVPDWPDPQRNETLTEYAERFSDLLRTHRPCVLAGMSFGGMLAQEMVRFLRPEALILISTIRGPDELPVYGRVGRLFRSLIPLLPIRMLQGATKCLDCPGVRNLFPYRRVLARQFRQADRALFGWSLGAICRWKERPKVDCPVWHIHGDRDRVLPACRTTPDCLVAGGGHARTLTHPDVVNQFLEQHLQSIAGTADEGRPVTEFDVTSGNSPSLRP